MSQNNTASAESFVNKVLANEATKRGIASAVAGILIAVATEALAGRS